MPLVNKPDKYTPFIVVGQDHNGYWLSVETKRGRYHSAAIKEKDKFDAHLERIKDMYNYSKIIDRRLS